MKLIIDKTTGTVLNLEGCVIVETDDLNDYDSHLLEEASDSELSDIGERCGISIEQMGRDTGWGDNKYKWAVSYSPLSIKDECESFMDGGIYDETDREWNAVKWIQTEATKADLEDLSDWIMSSESVWEGYRSNLMEWLLHLYNNRNI
jgi:hypothetical protein